MSESGGGRPGLPVPNSPCGPCGRKTTLNERTPRYFGRLTGGLEGEETAGRVDVLGLEDYSLLTTAFLTPAALLAFFCFVFVCLFVCLFLHIAVNLFTAMTSLENNQ